MRKMVEGIVVALGIAFMLAFGCSLMVRAGSSDQEDWREYIEKICAERSICPELVEAIIEKESSWDPIAENGNCIGLMQIDQTQHLERMKILGVSDLTDPYDNILVGVDILEELFWRYQDKEAVLMYYNAGYSEKYGLGAYRRGETSSYANEVMQRAMELEELHGKYQLERGDAE